MRLQPSNALVVTCKGTKNRQRRGTSQSSQVNPTSLVTQMKVRKLYSISSHIRSKNLAYDWFKMRGFQRAPRGYWSNESIQRIALEKLGREKFGVKELKDWYNVTATSVKSELNFITTYHNNSLFTALKKLYPEYEWNPIYLQNVPKGYLDDENLQRVALERVGREIGVKELDDWHSINTKEVVSVLPFIAHRYNNSLFNALKKLYPNHNWNPFLRKQVPKGYWDDENVQRAAFERVGEKLGVKELDDWYSVSVKSVRSELPFINKFYNNSLFSALKKLYPHHNWDPSRCSHLPKGYWRDESRQRDALERLGRERLGVEKLDDWYSVNASDVQSKLSFLNTYYSSSLFNALKTLYPHHNWNPLRFQKSYHGYWKDEATSKYYHELFSQWKVENNIQSVGDWYALPPEKIKLVKRASKNIFGSVENMIKQWFPSTNQKLGPQTGLTQLELGVMLKHVVGTVNHK